MSYEDFPILGEQEYLKIYQQYNLARDADFHTLVSKVYLDLNTCKKICFSLSENLNKKLCNALISVREIVDLALENLSLTFNIQNLPTTEIKDFNIFTFLNCLINSINNLHSLSQTAQKTYHKTVADKTITQLITCAINITQALEKSNIKIFKYL